MATLASGGDAPQTSLSVEVETARPCGSRCWMGLTAAFVVAGVLLAEYHALALIAAAAGLVTGRLAAPLLTDPGTGLLGTAGAPDGRQDLARL